MMKENIKNNLFFAVLSFGFASMATQILLLRELSAVFYGNELAIGIMLASWLLWVAAGSAILSPTCQFIENKLRRPNFTEDLFYTLLLFTSIITPFSILLIRNLKNILNISTGEMIGLIPAAVSSFVLLAPVCLVFGSLFAASCRLLLRFSENRKAEEAGKIYLLESFGAAAGGLAFNFLLVRVLNPVQIALLCGLINICATLLLLDKKQGQFKRRISISLIIIAALLLISGANGLDLKMRKIQWKGMDLIAVKDSYYGNIVLTKIGAQLNVFENGLLLTSTNDPMTAEESVHYTLLEHPDPREVLLIGGILSEIPLEILKHPVKKLDCVELDPDTIKMAKDNYPAESLGIFDEKRAVVNFVDGRLFVKKLAGEKLKKYDVIILALPPPFTAQLNRFYSIEFYRQIDALLNKGGIFSFGVSSSENYISSIQARFLGSLHKSLKKEFKDVKVLPGDTCLFLSSNSAGGLTYDYEKLIKRLKERNLSLKYVNQYNLPFKFDRFRIEYLENAIDQAKSAKINRDFYPIGYFYDMALWSTKFNSRTKEFLEKIDGLKAWPIALALILIFGISFIPRINKKMSGNSAVLISIGAAGFSGMLLQIAIIIGFQATYGYVYHKIGIIFASFMLGMALGSLASIEILRGQRCLFKTYTIAQLSLSVFSFILPAILLFFKDSPILNVAQKTIIETLFLGLPAIAGFIGGFLFPIANKIYSENSLCAGKTAGLLYGVDLFGACLGALLTSAILIPILGMNTTCYLTGLMNFLIFLLFLSRTIK
ncbi:MAG: fused MFS/spermidine synthase [Candidatus Omnitrophota bacterium]